MQSMEMTKDHRVYTCWVLMERDPEAPHLWVSHCLNFDVVAHGESPSEAMTAAIETAQMAVVDDLLMNLDPNGRSAPEADWDRLWAVVNHGLQVKLSEMAPDAKVMIAGQFTINVEQTVEAHPLTDPDRHQHPSPLRAEPIELDERIPTYAKAPSAQMFCASPM